MIEYTTIEEDGITRACFNQGDDYFEIALFRTEDETITPIPEDEIQSHLVEQVNLLVYPRTDEEEVK
jgi:hypothetical protein